MNKLVFTSALLTVALQAGAWGMSETVMGQVTCEGKPVADVVVSDGFNCVTTDAAGNYAFNKNDRAKHIFISTPSGYVPAVNDLTHPQFYLPVKDNQSIYNFELTVNPNDDKHHVMMTQADVQVVSESELGMYDTQVADAREHLRQYKDKGLDVFAADMGDIVGDHPELYRSALEHRAGLEVPVYLVLGNHDMQYYGRTHETSYGRFEDNFGPAHYSFNKGNAHYVVLDNVFYIGRDYFYMGYIDEQTFDWLEQDLKNVPEGAPVFVMMHIPTRLHPDKQQFKYDGANVAQSTVNAEHLYKLLKPYNAHIVSGHQHVNFNIQIDDNIIEHNTAAACGTWWDLPICEDGTPQGYGIYEVDGNDVKWYFKPLGESVDYQFRGYGIGQNKGIPDEITANVWNYDPQWHVEWLEDGKLMGEMTRYNGVDPKMVEMSADKSKLRYSWIGAANTDHMFRAKPVNPEATITIRVTDRFGNVYERDVK